MYLRDKRTAHFRRVDLDIELVAKEMPILQERTGSKYSYMSTLLTRHNQS